MVEKGGPGAEEGAVLEEGDAAASWVLGEEEEGADDVAASPGLAVGPAVGLVEDPAVEVSEGEAVGVEADGRLALRLRSGPAEAHVRGREVLAGLVQPQLVVPAAERVRPVVGARRAVAVGGAPGQPQPVAGHRQLRRRVHRQELQRALRGDARGVEDGGQGLEGGQGGRG